MPRPPKRTAAERAAESAAAAEARRAAKAARRQANQRAWRATQAARQADAQALRLHVYDRMAKDHGLTSGQQIATTLAEIRTTLRAGGRYDWTGKAAALAHCLEEIAVRGMARLRDPAVARILPEPSAKVTQLALEALLARAAPVGQPLTAADPLRVEVVLLAPGSAPGLAGHPAPRLLAPRGVDVHLAGDGRHVP
jgi:hypothetical protein